MTSGSTEVQQKGNKMKTLTIFCTTFLLLLVASSLPAVAGTVTMQFNNAGGNSYNGVSSYPYAATVNGVPFSAMCISYNEHITNGETWTATYYTVDQYAQIVGQQKADELAWLFSKAEADGGSNSGYNAAAWYLNEQVPGLDQNAQGIYDTVTNPNLKFQAGEFPGVYFYVPVNGTESWQGETPQTFMGVGATPEPGTLLTLGTAVIGLAGLARKRLFS
jgi:hypothetical protein